MNAGFAECLHLLSRSALATGNDRACMAHASSRWRRLTGDERDDWLGHILFRKSGRLFFSRTADLADHHDSERLVVCLEQSQCIDVCSTDNWIATDTDSR